MIARPAFLVAMAFFSLRPAASGAQTASGGARDAALAGAAIAPISGDVADLWSESNPAGWSHLAGFAAAIHAAQLYGLDELRLGAVQAGFSLDAVSIVAGVRSFGYSDYRETIVTAGAGRAVYWGTHRPIHAGIRIRYHQTAIRSYGSASAIALSVGLGLPVAPGTVLGLSAENVFVNSGRLERELPRRMHAGLSISAGAVGLLVGAVKEMRTPLAARFGIEVYPVETVALRAGYALEPPRFAGGVGLRVNPIAIDIAAEHHFVLGWTPSCSVGIRW